MGAVEHEQVEELRRWAHGLATDPRPEVQAAAKAITLLADDLEATRSQLLEERMIREALEGTRNDEDGSTEAEPGDVERDLRARIRAILPPRLSRRP